MKTSYQTMSFQIIEYGKDIIATSGLGRFNTDWFEDEQLTNGLETVKGKVE